MARSSKFTPEIHQLIGDSITLGLPYSLAAAFAGITYQISMIGAKKAKIQYPESIFSAINIFPNNNADGALKILQRLNEAA